MTTLEITWVVSLLVMGLFCSWYAAIKGNDGWVLGCVCSLFMAVVFAWDNAITLTFMKIQMLLPDYDTELNKLTAALIVAGGVLVGMFTLLLSPFLFMDRDAKVGLKNFLAIVRKNG